MHDTVAETLLQELETGGDDKKQALSRACRENGPTAYPLKVTPPELESPSLLDRVQNIPDVEKHLRILRGRRIKDRDSAVYITPLAKSSLQAADISRFPLMDRVKEFLDGDQKVFLLLGDSGAGKSTFSSELEFDLWQSYESKTGRIPLLINLPTIDKPEDDMIAKQLKRDGFREPQIEEMKHYRKLILICDGYDECQQTKNIYMSNRLNQRGEWDVQMVVCCRSEYLGSDYRDRFQPGNRNQLLDSPLFQEAVLTPFSADQIEDYIEQYVSIHKPLWRVEDYKSALDLIPSCKELIKNPFLMTLSLDVLPRMIDQGRRVSPVRVTRVILYDLFIEQWLERGKKRLSEKEMIPQAKAAFEKLSSEGFTLNGIGYLKKFSVAIYMEQGGHPVVEYTRMIDEGSWKDKLFENTEKQLLLEACPLTRNGNQHQFIHRSILEYGLARAVFDPKDRKNRRAIEQALSLRGGSSNSGKEPDSNSPLFFRSFVKEHSLLQFLEERVQQEPVFKDQLLTFIEHSKKDEIWSTAAANAITILVRAGVQFIGTDLQGIQIPGADLSYGMFDSVHLQQANIRGANLRGIWLRQTDLNKADMTDVQFGELPELTMDSIVWCCAYSPDGTSFVVGLDSGIIQMYSTSNWERTRVLKGHGDTVRRVVFSPDGSHIYSGSHDNTVQIWIKESGVSQHTLSHPGKVQCVAYSPRGDQVASACSDKEIRLWDPSTGICCQILSGHEDIVMCAVYSPKGNQLASGSDDCTVRLWNIVARECSHIFVGHSRRIMAIVFSPRGDQVATASLDTTIRLWDVESEHCGHILEGHSSFVCDIVYSLKGDQVFSGSNDGAVRVWDVQSGTCSHTMTGPRLGLVCVAYSPRGDTVASGGCDKNVRLWNLSVGESQHISNCHSQMVSSVKSSPKGNMIASSSLDFSIRLWDAETGVCLKVLSGHTYPVPGIAFSPKGNQIASGSHDETVRLWDVDTGTCQHILTGHTNQVNNITYSPEGDQVASAGEDKTVRLWSATTGKHCGTLNGHTDEVTSVAYSPNGSMVATSSKDKTVKLWDVGMMACIYTFQGHQDLVHDVVFSPQGDQLASASYDGSVNNERLLFDTHWSPYDRESSLLAQGRSTRFLQP